MPYRIRHCLLMLATACLIGATACGEAERPPNVILVVVDTLRADHLGLYGYDKRPTSPILDRRAESAVVYDHCYSTSSWTLPAMATMYTGELPTRHKAGMRIRQVENFEGTLEDIGAFHGNIMCQLDAGLPTLAEKMAEAGYETGAIVNNVFLGPSFGLDRGFETLDCRIDQNRTAAETVDLALSWLDERGDRPFFFVLHFFDPHDPYRAPPPFRNRFAAPLVDSADPAGATVGVEELWKLVSHRQPGWERALEVERAAYDEEIAYTDHELERFWTALSERGLWDESIVAFTSDHGEGFYEHSFLSHGNTMHDELIRVPLVVWAPEAAPGRRAAPVSLLDLMPTLLAGAGVQTGDPLPGLSLWDSIRAQDELPDRPLIAERLMDVGDTPTEEQKAVVRWPHKAIAHMDTDQGKLFDLATDPQERRDLFAESHDLFLRLAGQLQEVIWTHSQEQGQLESATLDDKTLKRLRDLGYVR